MKIHEFQAKALFRKYNIPVPDGQVVSTPEEAVQVVQDLGGLPVVLKAQIHAGGRGKGGGVKLARTIEEVKLYAHDIIWMNLITPQTGPQGRLVKKILIEAGQDIKKELYLSLLPDRDSAKILIMASLAGGMDIEEVAETDPDKIIKVFVDPLIGIQPFHSRKVAFGLGLSGAAIKNFTQMLNNLYELFMDYNCSLLEINPLVLTEKDEIVALDAKLNFDDNGLFRHPDLKALRDIDEEDPLEIEASKYNLNYIKMDGNVGNMVNGAGLAMATMDLIKQAGAEPANFLDVGGGANATMVENAFRLMLMDQNVKAILINIFGGILRCDVLAEGVVEAAKKTGLNVPVVIRMEGTNVEAGRKILADSGLNLIPAKDLKQAALKIADLAQ